MLGIRPENVEALCQNMLGFFHGIGIVKKHELFVLSKCLSLRNKMALGQRDHPEDIPKWIPKQFLHVTAKVLLERAAI